MAKVTRIPNLFGIDGYALPETFRKYKEPTQGDNGEEFGKIFDFALEKERRKENGEKNRRTWGDVVRDRGQS